MKYFSLIRDGIIPMKISSRIISLIFSFLLIPDFSLANQDQEIQGADREVIGEEQSVEETSDTDLASGNPRDSDRPIEEIQVLGSRTL